VMAARSSISYRSARRNAEREKKMLRYWRMAPLCAIKAGVASIPKRDGAETLWRVIAS
jgi:hypothetical protein